MTTHWHRPLLVFGAAMTVLALLCLAGILIDPRQILGVSAWEKPLKFAVSTAVEADIILMDEWLSVGDSEFILKAEKRLENFIKRSSILVIASHSDELIQKTTNQVLRLEHGK